MLKWYLACTISGHVDHCERLLIRQPMAGSLIYKREKNKCLQRSKALRTYIN